MNVTTDTRARAAGPAQGNRAPRRPGPRQPGQREPQPGRAHAQAQAPARPRTDTRAARSGAAQAPAPGSAAAEALSVARTPFIVLLLGLLGGGLVCLLVINTTLAAASFRISDLQKENVQLAQQQQTLQQQVASEESPATIERQAYHLGMRPQSILSYVDLKTGRKYTSAPTAPIAASVPGYGP
jgi:hypothetical protein